MVCYASLRLWQCLNPDRLPRKDTSRCALSLHYILIWSTSYASCAHVMRDAAAAIYKITKDIDGHIVVDG